MKILIFTVFTSLFLMGSGGNQKVKQSSDFNSGDETQVILRLDDIGFCHSVNMASKILAEVGLPYSTSLMVSCPWYKEALKWAQRSYEIYNDKLGRDYAKVLLRRQKIEGNLH